MKERLELEIDVLGGAISISSIMLPGRKSEIRERGGFRVDENKLLRLSIFVNF